MRTPDTATSPDPAPRMMKVTDVTDVRVGDRITCRFQSNGRSPVELTGIAEADGGAIVVGPATVKSAAGGTPAYTTIVSVERPIDLPTAPWALIVADDDDQTPRFALLRPDNTTGITWVDDHGVPMESREVEQLLVGQAHRVVFRGDTGTAT